MQIKHTNTENYIAQAFMLLLQKKDYNSITITELTEKAGVGRRSFYRHFKDTQEVLNYCFNTIVDNFELDNTLPFDQFLQIYFEQWLKNKVFFKTFLHSGHSAFVLQGFISNQLYRHNTLSNIDDIYFKNMVSYGICSLLFSWSLEDFSRDINEVVAIANNSYLAAYNKLILKQ